MAKKFEIRNSTAEFLTFVAEGKEQGIQVLYKDETVWATQKAMALLFDCSADNIGLHLKNIFKCGELVEDSVTEKNSATAEKISVVQQAGCFYKRKTPSLILLLHRQARTTTAELAKPGNRKQNQWQKRNSKS